MILSLWRLFFGTWHTEPVRVEIKHRVEIGGIVEIRLELPWELKHWLDAQRREGVRG